MTSGIPITITHQVEAAIRGAFDHDELWRATRPMGDLHDHVTHTSFAVEVTELVDWVGKRSRTVELLKHLHTAVPGNPGLQTAKDAYIAAEKEVRENPPPVQAAAFAGAQLPEGTRHGSTITSTGSGRKRIPAPPWAWMVLGALALFVLAFIFLGGEDEPDANAVPTDNGNDVVLDDLYDDCESGMNAACDSLFEVSEEDSEYEDFGFTCGDLLPDGPTNSCVADLGP